jgi:hypothetical protein
VAVILVTMPVHGQGGAGDAWPLFTPGMLPPGTALMDTEAASLSAEEVGNQIFYLIGQFVVTASGKHRAVLRTGGQGGPVRIVVAYPPTVDAPPEGAIVARDATRAFKITDVRVNTDGQATIYVREIIRMITVLSPP